jgi:hypothetical protein
MIFSFLEHTELVHWVEDPTNGRRHWRHRCTDDDNDRIDVRHEHDDDHGCNDTEAESDDDKHDDDDNDNDDEEEEEDDDDEDEEEEELEDGRMEDDDDDNDDDDIISEEEDDGEEDGRDEDDEDSVALLSESKYARALSTVNSAWVIGIAAAPLDPDWDSESVWLLCPLLIASVARSLATVFWFLGTCWMENLVNFFFNSRTHSNIGFKLRALHRYFPVVWFTARVESIKMVMWVMLEEIQRMRPLIRLRYSASLFEIFSPRYRESVADGVRRFSPLYKATPAPPSPGFGRAPPSQYKVAPTWS